MDIITILKFIKEYNIETREVEWEFLLFVDYFLLDEFSEMVWKWYFDDEWYQVTLKYWYICIDIVPICEYYDINIKRLLLAINRLY